MFLSMVFQVIKRKLVYILLILKTIQRFILHLEHPAYFKVLPQIRSENKKLKLVF